MGSFQKLIADPRHFQIVTLSTLLALQLFWADLPPSFLAFIIIISSVLSVQYLFSHFLKLPFDFRSPVITGLSLTILFKASFLWIYPLAAIVAIGSKFLIRVKDRHIFNPANIGIVAMLVLLPEYSWISPGQWGSHIWLAALLVCFAFLVLFKVSSRDMAFLFLFFWVGALVLRALWLGDPLSIPLHQLQSGALLIFAFFMISDPKTIPPLFWQRLIFALVVTIVAYILTFEFRIRESLFYALAIVCLITPLIQYNWKIPTFLTKGKIS